MFFQSAVGFYNFLIRLNKCSNVEVQYLGPIFRFRGLFPKLAPKKFLCPSSSKSSMFRFQDGLDRRAWIFVGRLMVCRLQGYSLSSSHTRPWVFSAFLSNPRSLSSSRTEASFAVFLTHPNLVRCLTHTPGQEPSRPSFPVTQIGVPSHGFATFFSHIWTRRSS